MSVLHLVKGPNGCGSCKFGHGFTPVPSTAVPDGECRRNAPSLIVGPNVARAVWPRVARTDLCGEYRRGYAETLSAAEA